MKTWMSVLAVAVAGPMVAASAFAQGTATTPTPPSDTPASAEQPKDTSTPSAAEQPKDSATPAPAASPKTDEAKDAAKETKDAAKDSGRRAKDAMREQKDAMKADMKAPRGTQEHVRAAQQALKEKGHDPGPIDGVMGPKTQAALKDFQKAQGLKDTGRLDAETMAKLGVEARTGARDTSTPAASPKTGPGASTSTPEMGKDAGSTKDAAKAPAGAPKRP